MGDTSVLWANTSVRPYVLVSTRRGRPTCRPDISAYLPRHHSPGQQRSSSSAPIMPINVSAGKSLRSMISPHNRWFSCLRGNSDRVRGCAGAQVMRVNNGRAEASIPRSVRYKIAPVACFGLARVTRVMGVKECSIQHSPFTIHHSVKSLV